MSRIFDENVKKNYIMLFELLPFFEFCKCDILESIIGRDSKLLSACRRLSGENLKKNSFDFFLIIAV